MPRHPPYADGPIPRSSLLQGCTVLCQEQSLSDALDTGLLLMALVLAAQEDVTMTMWLPCVIRPVWGWQLVQCGTN